MKEKNYILKKIHEKLKSKELINSGYAEIYYALFKINFELSYADKEWINQDKLFTTKNEVLDIFVKIAKLEIDTYYDFSLTSVIGSALGVKKINKFILDENKKAKLLTYKNYLVCDFEKLKSGDFLSGANYICKEKLDNLIVIAVKQDDEKEEELISLYEECGFDVVEVSNKKIKNISDAIKSAKKSKTQVLIIVQNENKEISFSNYVEYDLVNDIKERTNLNYKKWLIEYDKEINERHENVLEIINYLKIKKINIDLENIQFNLEANYESSIVNSSDKIFKIITGKSKYFTHVDIKDERLASLIALGLSISGLKPSVEVKNLANIYDIISLANENELAVNFIVKNNASQVYIPNLNIYNPSDMHEVIGMWATILKLNTTSVLILSDVETTLVKNTNIKYVKYGAYMIKKETGILSGVIVSSGEDLKLALGVAGLLEKEDIILRVVTMPCANLLLKQVKYIKELLPSRVKIFMLDKNLNIVNSKFTSNDDCLISSELGLDKVKEKIKEILE